MVKLDKVDYTLIYEKIEKIKTKSIVSIVSSIVAILGVFFLPLSFLPKSGRITTIDKSLTFFEYSKIISLLILIGLVSFEYYFIFIFLKYKKIQDDYANGKKNIQSAIVTTFYDFKDLDGDKIQVVFKVNNDLKKINLTKLEFSKLELKRNEAITLETLPLSFEVVRISKTGK